MNEGVFALMDEFAQRQYFFGSCLIDIEVCNHIAAYYNN